MVDATLDATLLHLGFVAAMSSFLVVGSGFADASNPVWRRARLHIASVPGSGALQGRQSARKRRAGFRQSSLFATQRDQYGECSSADARVDLLDRRVARP